MSLQTGPSLSEESFAHRALFDALELGLLVGIEIPLGLLGKDVAHPLLRRFLKGVRPTRLPISPASPHG